MLIEIRSLLGLGILLILLSTTISVAQKNQTLKADTISIRPFARYWTKPRVVPKVGFGVQETGFGEIGAQLHQIYVHPLSLASMGPYISVDGVFQTDEVIIGPKAGYELTAGLLGLAADFTYYTDFDKHKSVMFTPKAGISLFGYVSIFYGRNINLNDETFKAISSNRFSIIFNLNPDYYNIREARKMPQRARR
ncbi:hypothetical protein [Chryseosolibacter indicus]|uniref:Outer membrane protein beta-barrel domain-containing protein n=1 Tax=Chryseosolibacter indicus TaxID=2782351 RepID=A0ABS5VN39_9BACT|nr:hypothetical protein [Chryseosolibacter indicus]MBT1702269.1 hypothetical protein [Chryseosolibacter indicus]